MRELSDSNEGDILELRLKPAPVDGSLKRGIISLSVKFLLNKRHRDHVASSVSDGDGDERQTRRRSEPN